MPSSITTTALLAALPLSLAGASLLAVAIIVILAVINEVAVTWQAS